MSKDTIQQALEAGSPSGDEGRAVDEATCRICGEWLHPNHREAGTHPDVDWCINVLRLEVKSARSSLKAAEAVRDAAVLYQEEADRRYRELANQQGEAEFGAGWWRCDEEKPDEGGLYIATVITEFYDGKWRSEDHHVDLSRYVRMYRDAPFAPDED